MTVAEAIRDGEAALAADGVPSPRLDSEVLLALVIGARRDLLPARFRDPVASGDLDRFHELLDRRGGGKVPLQYLTGVQEFYSLEFLIRPGALIPRPETELLVDEMIAFAREREGEGQPVRAAADVGTGSGCIAVAAAVSVPGLRVLALDVSPDAVRIATENADRHGVLGGPAGKKPPGGAGDAPGHRDPPLEGVSSVPTCGVTDRGVVAVVLADLLAPLRAGSVDAVLSNPPYVASRELEGLQEEVRVHEPRVALVSGVTGLEIYERLIPQAARVLRPGGLLALELAAGRHGPVQAMLEGGPWTSIAFREDFQGFPRVIVARKEKVTPSRPAGLELSSRR